MQNVYEYLKPSIPGDHCHQSRATDLVSRYVKNNNPKLIMDLGCGVGNTVEYFRRILPESRWVGVDIYESPEVKQRTRSDAEFVSFDGINIPFGDETVDLIYSNQVFEHVRYPERLLQEVRRVLAKNGAFIGQTSQLEPYHSYSYWNFTVFGFKVICEDAGLDLVEIRPGIDAQTLLKRSYLGRPPEYSQWFSKESPLNQEIEGNAKQQKRGAQTINYRKLMNCGQFCFICKPSQR